MPSFLYISRIFLADEKYGLETLDGPIDQVHSLFWGQLEEHAEELRENELEFVLELIELFKTTYEDEDYKYCDFYDHGQALLKKLGRMG